MDYVPKWRERLEEAKRFVGPAIAGAVVLALAAWLVWHEVLPRAAARRGVTEAPKDAAARLRLEEKISAEVATLERDYKLAVETGASEATVAALLDAAIEKQRGLVRLAPADATEPAARLVRLEAARGSLRSKIASIRSETAEQAAQAARKLGKNAEALEKLREAWRLQREANERAATVALKDLPRESRLLLAVTEAEAAPARDAARASLALAHAAAARERWDEALAAFSEARKAQVDLNARHAGTRIADLGLVAEIDAEIATLKAAGLAATTVAREREANAALAAGRVADAAAALAAAAAAQREINEKFPRSRFVAATRADELDVRRQTALAAAPLKQAAALDREAAEHLRRRQGALAGQRLRAAAELLAGVAAEFPRHTGREAALDARVAWLAAHADGLDALQVRLFERLAPLPGAEQRLMLKSEVTQELYVAIMNANPSRQSGRALPVESVNWHEAREFCQRIGWVLGLPVRLPREAEFRAEFSRAAPGWTIENSGGRTHDAGSAPAAKTVFADLAGNVAEWLEPADGAERETAPVAGGSILDSAADLRELPLIPTERRTRARHIGFRIVVETGGG
ncbi:MAG: hypothetical protein RLZZ15_512 [Verrucomicrobiota bacterium]